MAVSLITFLLTCLITQGNTAYFSQQPSDQAVVAGHSVTLGCAVNGYRGIVQWTKDGLALGGERDLPGWSRYSVSGEQSVGEHNLRIESAQLQDDALYECQATQVGLRSRVARLNVLVAPNTPVIEAGPIIKLRHRAPYNLTCLVSGAKPSVTINWYKDGELQNSAIDTKAFMDDGKRENATSVLPIIPESQDTGSIYTCRVSNQAAPAGKQASVTLNVQYPPEVSLSVHPTPVLEGSKVKFICSAAANPELLSYRWAKGQSSLAGVTGDTFEVEVDHTFFTEPVSCTVTNTIGTTNASALVDVHFGPRLVTEPRSLTVDLGTEAVFTCSWISNPPLTLAWTKKGSSVILSNGNSLHLRAVTQEDSGTYVCKAIVPRIGVAEKELKLTVHGPPIISSDNVQRADPGERAKIECIISSSPAPEKIVWSWRENVLESGYQDRYSVETIPSDTGTTSTLSIDRLTHADFQPLYNCTAWNSFGYSTLVISLKERDVLRFGFIIGTAVGVVVLLMVVVVTLVSTCRGRSGKAEKGVRLSKSDIRVQIVHSEDYPSQRDEEEEEPNHPMAMKSEFRGTPQKQQIVLLEEEEGDGQEVKDPTNGYYNVCLQEDPHLPSGRGFSEYVAGTSSEFDHCGLPPTLGYNPRHGQLPLYNYSLRYLMGDSSFEPHNRLYPRDPVYGAESFLPAEYSRSFSTFVNSGMFGKAENCDHIDQPSKLSDSARFSYASSQLSDYSRPSLQRMQTHV